MKLYYNVAYGNVPITVIVTVDTIGRVYCEFSVATSSNEVITSGKSTLISAGKPYNAVLGTSDELKNTVVTIRLHVDFTQLNTAQQETALDAFLENSPVLFVFSGGEYDARQYTFSKEQDLHIAPDKKNVFVTTQIALK